ncbi:MAG: DMP19 family protein [Gammaproteobacteria bacterium]|nr:DMP19 family protein [Gammaproteobacteria bacterium]MDH5803062.1 DMP19 family protein [Gammaproteobacteria bacterium]
MILNEILSEPDDELLLMNLVEYLTTQSNFDIRKLPEVPRNVVAVVTAQAIIDNGGFRQFFESEFDGTPDYHLFVEAYEAIGAAESARAIEQALELFPEGRPPENWVKKEKCIKEIFTGNEGDSLVQNIQGKILGNDRNYQLTAQYARENLSGF